MAQGALATHSGEIPYQESLGCLRCQSVWRWKMRAACSTLASSRCRAMSWQPTNVADAGDRIGKGQLIVQIGVNLAGGHRKRRGGQDVKLVEDFIHLYL